MRLLFTSICLFALAIQIFGQQSLGSSPTDARLVISDIQNFWLAFDEFNSNGGNPFVQYLEEGSTGLKDFIPYRIESPRYLKKTVRKRKSDYERIRVGSSRVRNSFDQIRNIYNHFEELYDSAVFPTTYFVIGAFNSGGTSTKSGLIIGVEMQNDISNIPFIVAHELIHFNQNYPLKRTSLLEQSIREGSADFIGELISGRHINEHVFKYGEANEESLCVEFVTIMNDYKYHGWLYGSSGKKKGRPNDLGYWIGYKITQSYYERKSNKKQAIVDILNISDFEDFLFESGYLAKYISNNAQ